MQIIPVLDLLNGVVVRGVAGQRNEYRPIVSRLTDRSDALSVANAFRAYFGLTTLYVADLDAILNQRPNKEIYATLRSNGFRLLVDAGARGVDDLMNLIDAGVSTVIIGLESWPDTAALKSACNRYWERLTFSVDLKSGSPLGDLAKWDTDDPFKIASRAIAAGVWRMIVLDLAQVGVGAGLSTLPLCQRLRQEFPHVSLITGGGVRNAADLKPLREGGISGVLVASALHDGRLSADDIRCIQDDE